MYIVFCTTTTAFTLEKMSNKPHYHGHRARLREKLSQESTQLADYEVLELLLGTVLLRKDTKPLAKELLTTFGSIHGVLSARSAELRNIKGFGPALEGYWQLIREVIARFVEAPVRERACITDTAHVAEMARARLGAKEVEEFWAAFLDNQNRLLVWERIASGTMNSAAVYPRNLLEQALIHKASALIIVHNHPGGNVTPSPADIAITRQIDASAKLLGIRLLDHVIVTDEAHYSLKKDGVF